MNEPRKYRGGKVATTDDADATPSVDPLGCRATGCPLRGTVDFGNAGKFFCTAHSKALASEWHRITQHIRAQIGMVQFLSELQQRINFPSQFKEPWSDFAKRYWCNDTHCFPSRQELGNPQAYAYRMFGEFQWRIEASKSRPEPWIGPAPATRSGNVATLVDARADMDEVGHDAR